MRDTNMAAVTSGENALYNIGRFKGESMRHVNLSCLRLLIKLALAVRFHFPVNVLWSRRC